ncbi:hypothetical protein, partial [Paenibacillus dendritiformis]|uniref:hypothetical protein n=1 Tax=Paenibacillus dendritiformis TaxID=130049 RepID=UPI001BCECCFD
MFHYLMKFLQKRINFADYCFQTIDMAEIPAVFRLLENPCFLRSNINVISFRWEKVVFDEREWRGDGVFALPRPS